MSWLTQLLQELFGVVPKPVQAQPGPTSQTMVIRTQPAGSQSRMNSNNSKLKQVAAATGYKVSIGVSGQAVGIIKASAAAKGAVYGKALRVNWKPDPYGHDSVATEFRGTFTGPSLAVHSQPLVVTQPEYRAVSWVENNTGAVQGYINGVKIQNGTTFLFLPGTYDFAFTAKRSTGGFDATARKRSAIVGFNYPTAPQAAAPGGNQ